MSGTLKTARTSTAEPPAARTQLLKRRPISPGPGFVPLPPPRSAAPYRRALADVLGRQQLTTIRRSEALRFHCVGDTGGWRDGRPQCEVANAMVSDLDSDTPVHFFYHLGDVVYPHGEEAHYGPQFFAPYRDYDAPIFAIPGNHDGEAPVEAGTSPLEPFLRAFCSPSQPLHDAALRVRRPAAAQPHVHWTLVHERLWIIGLYTNVPEDGQVEESQLEWLTGELRAAPPQARVILAMHRPVYSIDVVHGSNLDLGDALDVCFDRAGRVPDAVVGAHAHAYQRFTRHVGDRQVPYVVVGSGGFHERHAAGTGVPDLPATFPGLEGVRLEAHQAEAHGYLTVTVTPSHAEAVYRTVSGDGALAYDRFVIPGPA